MTRLTKLLEHVYLLKRTGLVRVGKGRQQHMSKLHDNVDARRARGMHMLLIRALVVTVGVLGSKVSPVFQSSQVNRDCRSYM